MNIVIGNLFDSKKKTLVNTVNCVGVMGKGIAQRNTALKRKGPSLRFTPFHREVSSFEYSYWESF